jgi:molybdate transport system substrate-binding protein
LLAQVTATNTAEIKILCTGAVSAALNELAPQFERATGHKLVMKFNFAAILKRQIEAGETFDVAVLYSELVDDLIKQGKIVADMRANLARTGIGLAVRKGAPKPDISTTDAFKRTLLNAKSVAYGSEGGSGVYFIGLLERLKISEDMKAKLKPYAAGSAVEAVAMGEAEMVVNGPPLIVTVPGVELVGWFPSELQIYIDFTGGIGAATKEAQAG